MANLVSAKFVVCATVGGGSLLTWALAFTYILTEEKQQKQHFIEKQRCEQGKVPESLSPNAAEDCIHYHHHRYSFAVYTSKSLIQ